MIRVSKRIERIANCVLPGSRVVDVGTDHGLLPIYLLEQERATYAVASDLRQGPLSSARSNISDAQLADRIAVRLGSGLTTVESGEVDTCVIAGMGGKTVSEILEESPRVVESLTRMILQPMGGAQFVRQYLYEHDWKIEREEVFTYDDKFYELIVTEKGPPERQYAPYTDAFGRGLALEFGPLLLQCPTPEFMDFVKETVDRWKYSLQGLAQSESPAAIERRQSTEQRIAWIHLWQRNHETVTTRREPMSQQVLSAQDITNALDEFAPPSLAMEWDKIGLQVGRLDKPVQKVMLSLDASPAVIDHAIDASVDLLLTHHAMLFHALHRIDTSTARGLAIATALRHDLTVYNAHTNLDVAAGGVNDVLAELFGLQDVEILERLSNEKLRKLVVFVPTTHQEVVRAAVCEAGAGHIGGYSNCTFNTPGQGTFLPEAGATPFLGKVGELERAEEVRLETVVPESKIESVIRAMLAAHPYEEVAYDLYPLEIMGQAFGIGRIGTLAHPVSLEEFARQVATALGLPHVRFCGDSKMTVERVAVVGGSGGDFVPQALAKKVDVFVTADCDHHLVAEAWQDGLAMIDTTHAAMERPVLPAVKSFLAARFPELTIEVADIVEDPFNWT